MRDCFAALAMTWKKGATRRVFARHEVPWQSLRRLDGEGRMRLLRCARNDMGKRNTGDGEIASLRLAMTWERKGMILICLCESFY